MKSIVISSPSYWLMKACVAACLVIQAIAVGTGPLEVVGVVLLISLLGVLKLHLLECLPYAIEKGSAIRASMQRIEVRRS